MAEEANKIALAESQKQAIINKLVEAMEKHIQEMDVEYPCCDTYGWENLESESESDMEIDGLYIVYEYSVSCKYCSWTEYWTDPVCYPSFDETKDENGELISLAITDEDDEEIDEPTTEYILNQVNNILNPTNKKR